MAERGQIKNCIIDLSPLAFDNAISAESAKHKGIKSVCVPATPTCCCCPTLKPVMSFTKHLFSLQKLKRAAVVLGARAPIVLTSRSDSEESKLDSIVLAAAIADKNSH